MGVVQARDDGPALQIHDGGPGPDVGLDAGVVAHVDEFAVLHRQGRRRAERFVNGVDGPVDAGTIGLLDVSGLTRQQN